MSTEQFLAALLNLRGMVEQMSLIQPRGWDRDQLDAAIDCWDQLDKLCSDIGLVAREHAVALAERLPKDEYLHPRAGLIHKETESRVQWDGAGVLDALITDLMDLETGELTQAVPVDVLRQVIPAVKPGATSSKWNKTGLEAAGVDPEKFRSTAWGSRLVRRGPKWTRSSTPRHTEPVVSLEEQLEQSLKNQTDLDSSW